MASIPKDILQRCFTPGEWDWLIARDDFRSALEHVETLDAVEELSKTGDYLIRSRAQEERAVPGTSQHKPTERPGSDWSYL